jgi:quercetin dioxygenase-like cupin family protein
MTSLESGYHLAVDEGDAYDFLSTLSIVKATGTATGNALSVVETRLPAGFSPPPHIHHNEDEAFYLLNGRIEAQIGDQKIPAEQGAFLWLPRNVLHGFTVSADGPCTILTITTPAGFDAFVAEVGTPTTSIELPQPSEPDIPRLLEISARYGIEYPPPPDHSPTG